MEARKWEELPIDCMVDILGRVGLESLLFDVPFVCKSWYKATLSPLCWKQLDFPVVSVYEFDDPFIVRFERQYGLRWEICTTKFVKGVVDRSAGCATSVLLPSCYSEKALITYVADKCPALKKLVINSSLSETMIALSFVIGKLRNLEVLSIHSVLFFNEIISAIGAHCENFAALYLDAGRLFDNIGEYEVMAIVSCLPKIKGLALRNVFIERENLFKLLKGCGDLECLYVDYCCGFVENDEELLKLASHIPKFRWSGSVVHFFDDCDGCDDCDGRFY